MERLPHLSSSLGRFAMAALSTGLLTAGSVVVASTIGAATSPATPTAPSAGPALSAGSAVRVTGTGGEARFAVGYETQTFTDTSRPTQANGAAPALPSRTLQTFIFYPATGPAPRAGVGGAGIRLGAVADRSAGPFPLIVFAHGFGTDPTLSEYSSLLEQWAAAGYVVAAPLFPLTRGDAPGGPDLADFANQPADMGFVANQVVALLGTSGNPLSGLVNPKEIGAAGHSLGGVTTLGAVANTCCRISLFKAAVVMSGDPITFPTGSVNYAQAPPLLLVHGNADQAVPYVSSIDAFNGASAPKGLLTVVGGNHDSPVTPTERAFSSVVRSTIDFFDRYLKGENAAALRLTSASDATHPAAKLVFVAKPGAKVTLPVPKVVARTLRATVTPTTGLTDGQKLTVSWEGFAPGLAINILQCSVPHPAQASDCNLQTATLLHADPQGAGSLPFVVHTGLAGTGTCDASHPQCVVVINQGGSLSPAATVATPITFAP